MTIHWLWLPLIITLFFWLLASISDGFEREVNSFGGFLFGIIGVLCLIVSIFIYAIAFFIWVYNDLTIKHNIWKQ